jgi:hypothetical protein
MTQNVGTNDEAVTGSEKWVIFLTYERNTTNLRGTLVENVGKKTKIIPP